MKVKSRFYSICKKGIYVFQSKSRKRLNHSSYLRGCVSISRVFHLDLYELINYYFLIPGINLETIETNAGTQPKNELQQ